MNKYVFLYNDEAIDSGNYNTLQEAENDIPRIEEKHSLPECSVQVLLSLGGFGA